MRNFILETPQNPSAWSPLRPLQLFQGCMVVCQWIQYELVTALWLQRNTWNSWNVRMPGKNLLWDLPHLSNKYLHYGKCCNSWSFEFVATSSTHFSSGITFVCHPHSLHSTLLGMWKHTTSLLGMVHWSNTVHVCIE